MTNTELWQAALGELELSLSQANFTTWFKHTFISSFEKGLVIINVPNTFTKAWLEKKYHSAIIKALQNITKTKIKEIVYNVGTQTNTPRKKIITIPSNQKTSTDINNNLLFQNNQDKTQETINKFGLNPKYKFSNFIVGKGNELAHAACQAVTARPGRAYNPLFLYGGAGLGKTHLLHALGNHFLAHSPQKKVLYVTCEKFTNDFIYSIRRGKTKDFKDKYRNVGVLLVDDVQFITGKEGTQEEFFHTFNELHQSDRQIVISSDRPPKAIPALENRLLTRFEWGMIADITSPDLETRIAILEAKCKEKNYTLDERIIQFIASSVYNNVRELEGVLNKIIAYHQLQKTPPNFSMIKNIVVGFHPKTHRKSITPKQILTTVASFYDLNTDDLLGKSRERSLSHPRQIIMYLMREEVKSSYPTIGKVLGGRDHTTAIHACLKITKDMENNLKLQQEIETIKQQLYTPILNQIH